MPKKTGYLANVLALPPLIFRFQTNPDVLQDKKTYKYNPSEKFGQWDFDKTKAGKGLGSLTGFYDDLKEISSRAVATKPLEPEGGEQRVISLEFELDATLPEEDGSQHYGGSIEPDLAVLRSFMYPGLEWGDFFDLAKLKPWNRPPECLFKYGGMSVTCVMTDLSIKITAFFGDGKPQRAEVSATLKEQTLSLSPLIEFLERTFYRVPQAALQRPDGFGAVLDVMPVIGAFR